VPFLLLNCIGKHGKIAVGEGKLHINVMSKVISLLKWCYSRCDSSVLCMNVLHHNVLFISLGTDPL